MRSIIYLEKKHIWIEWIKELVITRDIDGIDNKMYEYVGIIGKYTATILLNASRPLLARPR